MPNLQKPQRSLVNKLDAANNIPLNSGDVFMNTFIPEKIKQSDFIKSVFMMYNLYATYEPMIFDEPCSWNTIMGIVSISPGTYFIHPNFEEF